MVVKVNYPNAKYHEGNKVLVYDGITIDDLKNNDTVVTEISDISGESNTGNTNTNNNSNNNNSNKI